MSVKIGLFLMLALLMLFLGWCWWTMRIENFDEDEEKVIQSITSRLNGHDVSLNLIQTGITGMQEQLDTTSAISLYNFLLAAPYINEEGDGYNFPKGDTGARGLQGLLGATGYKGNQGDKGEKGDKGDRGDHGIDGASIFDVSKYMLNGDTDLFKRKDTRKDSDKYDPQPVNAYTTLFD
jgi:hypothetical protein